MSDSIIGYPVFVEGKVKTLQPLKNGNMAMLFRHDATAGNGEKHAVIPGKGIINNYISAHIMKYLGENGIKTHFIGLLDTPYHQEVFPLDMIPLEVVVRNIAAGSLVKNSRGKYNKGDRLEKPLLQYFEKNDEKGDPEITREEIIKTGFIKFSEKTLAEIEPTTHKVNDLLRALFDSINITLVDFKLEYGRKTDGTLVLADEISPDNCRLWDKQDKDKIMDKDLFRQIPSKYVDSNSEVSNEAVEACGLIEAYCEVAKRLGIELPPLEKG